MKTLILYNSVSGNTKAVSEYIAGKTDGTAVKLKRNTTVRLEEYDSVYIGCMVYFGKLTRKIARFIRENKEILEKKNAKYFLCCDAHGEKGDRQMAKIAEKYGLPNCAYFVKGKRIAAKDCKEIDEFISR